MVNLRCELSMVAFSGTTAANAVGVRPVRPHVFAPRIATALQPAPVRRVGSPMRGLVLLMVLGVLILTGRLASVAAIFSRYLPGAGVG